MSKIELEGDSNRGSTQYWCMALLFRGANPDNGVMVNVQFASRAGQRTLSVYTMWPKRAFTRMQDIKYQLQAMTSECQSFRNFVHALKTESDENSTNLLARLRLGQSLESLLALVEVPISPCEGAFFQRAILTTFS